MNKEGNILTTVIMVFSHLQMKLKFKFNLRLKSLLKIFFKLNFSKFKKAAIRCSKDFILFDFSISEFFPQTIFFNSSLVLGSYLSYLSYLFVLFISNGAKLFNRINIKLWMYSFSEN